MKIKPGKYRTRGDQIAFITFVNPNPIGTHPVRGHVTDRSHSESWTINGKFFAGPAESNYDLVKRIPNDTPDPAGEAFVLDLVRTAVAEAESRGFVVTVSQRPLLPLAMGNYETVPSVRYKRERAK